MFAGKPIVVGERVTVDMINRLISLVESYKPVQGRNVQIDRTPAGSVINAEAGAPVAVATPPGILPQPWDIEIRQKTETESAAVRFARTYALRGGVFTRLTLITTSDSEWTSLPDLSSDSEWIIAGRISATVDESGTRSDTASIVYYANNPDGWTGLKTASATLLDSIFQPLYVLRFTAPADASGTGTWSVAEDLRTIPQLSVYA